MRYLGERTKTAACEECNTQRVTKACGIQMHKFGMLCKGVCVLLHDCCGDHRLCAVHSSC